jgi:hypothetical protein
MTMLTAQDLARRHDQAVTALWRGDPAPARTLTTWLAGFWHEDASSEPASQPAALSILGGGGAGIRWYDGDSTLLGYVRGVADRCYRVPTTAQLPSERSPVERSRGC